MKSYVVDSSVVAKCFITEDYSDKAIDAVESHTRGVLSFSAPSLIMYELGNVFWRHPQVTSEKTYTFFEKFLSLQIDLVDIWSDIDLLRNVCDISKARNVTFYDASYLALAEKNRTKLITADEDMCRKAPDFTVLLKEFKI